MRFAGLSSAIVGLILLAGCTAKDGVINSDSLATGSTSPAAALDAGDGQGPAGSYVKTRELAQSWTAHPGDEKIGIAYAENLGKLGQQTTQIEVLKAVSLAHPNDTALQARIGKQLLSANRAGEAATILERAVATNKADWKTYSALGSAYDQQGQYDLARAQYAKALALQPGALSVQNNLGMSYALQGKLAEAEKILRSAMAQPSSTAFPMVRQNLALVVGLEGRLDEAKQIASADLPPDQVQANMAYLQQMLAKPNTWAQLSAQNAAN